MEIRLAWRGAFTSAEANRLHAQAFGSGVFADEEWDWRRLVETHSLGWVTARSDDRLVGFVNVPWDGAMHAFIVDTVVSVRTQRQGIGTRLIDIAAHEASAAGCEWLHVDFEEGHRAFYLDACGFRLTPAGLRALGPQREGTGVAGPAPGC